MKILVCCYCRYRDCTCILRSCHLFFFCKQYTEVIMSREFQNCAIKQKGLCTDYSARHGLAHLIYLISRPGPAQHIYFSAHPCPARLVWLSLFLDPARPADRPACARLMRTRTVLRHNTKCQKQAVSGGCLFNRNCTYYAVIYTTAKHAT